MLPLLGNVEIVPGKGVELAAPKLKLGGGLTTLETFTDTGVKPNVTFETAGTFGKVVDEIGADVDRLAAANDGSEDAATLETAGAKLKPPIAGFVSDTKLPIEFELDAGVDKATGGNVLAIGAPNDIDDDAGVLLITCESSVVEFDETVEKVKPTLKVVTAGLLDGMILTVGILGAIVWDTTGCFNAANSPMVGALVATTSATEATMPLNGCFLKSISSVSSLSKSLARFAACSCS